MTEPETIAAINRKPLGGFRRTALLVFARGGVLPWFLLIVIVVFSVNSESFLTVQNLTSVARQSTYLCMVAIAQMIVLLTAGLDLSVGMIISITSVVGSMTMVSYYAAHPDSPWIAITLGCFAGLGAGGLVGVVNGIGIAIFRVAPFIMTLATSTIVFGISLTLTGGTPVYGLPDGFANVFGYGFFAGVPVPVWITIALVALMSVLLNWTRVGRYFYAVGGSMKASALSGINTGYYVFLAYVLCAVITSVAALMLVARLESGEPNTGSSYPLESIAACVIGGVSLFGGVGRLYNVVLGAIFIILLQNGLNLMKIGSYQQMMMIGTLLIVAVVADNWRRRLLLTLND